MNTRTGLYRPLPIAVLISGGGTTLRNLLAHIAGSRLTAEIRLVISSNPSAKGLQFARDAGIPTRIFTPRDFPGEAAFSDAIFAACREHQAELVVMGGFLKHVKIPADFQNRVVNIHPGLIPAFCGKGFYGQHVHQAVLDYGAKVSGCTVHFVDDEYDHGPIISQRTVPVLRGDTAASLAQRVFEQECEALPEAIQLIADRRVRVDGRVVKID
jgi:phosphoribosylglycinamide formyltransferase-1